jgi:hypothetical protein
MTDFESNINNLCDALGIDIESNSVERKQDKNSVFNPSIARLSRIVHKPCTAKIDPLTLPFIR